MFVYCQRTLTDTGSSELWRNLPTSIIFMTNCRSLFAAEFIHWAYCSSPWWMFFFLEHEEIHKAWGLGFPTTACHLQVKKFFLKLQQRNGLSPLISSIVLDRQRGVGGLAFLQVVPPLNWKILREYHFLDNLTCYTIVTCYRTTKHG